MLLVSFDLISKFNFNHGYASCQDYYVKTMMEFQTARQEFIAACQEQLQPIFEQWGLVFRGLSIEYQNIPEPFRQAAAGRTIISMEKEAQLEGTKVDVTLAQLERQKAYHLAQAETSKTLAIGKVYVELMQEQQRIGVDPLELKRIEAAKTLAVNPSQSSLIDTRPQIVNQILGQPSPSHVKPIEEVSERQQCKKCVA